MNEQPNSLNHYYVNIRKIWEKPTVKKFSTTTATLALVAFFLLVALKPTVETIFSLNKKIQDMQEVESKMSRKIADLNFAISQYQQLQPYLYLLDEYYPKSPEAGQVVEILNQNSKLSGFNNPTFSLSSYQITNGTGTFTINYRGENNFSNAVNFLTNLDLSNRLINLTGFDLIQLTQEKILSVTVGGMVYYEK